MMQLAIAKLIYQYLQIIFVCTDYRVFSPTGLIDVFIANRNRGE